MHIMVIAVALGSIVLCPMDPCFAAEPKDTVVQIKHASPGAAFDAFRNAYSKRDWSTLFTCLTPSAQEREVYSAFEACLLNGNNPKIAAALKKFGVDEEAVEAEFKKAKENGGKRPQTPQDLLRDIAARKILDKAAFYVATSKLLEDGDDLLPSYGKIEHLAVRGNAATAEITMTAYHLEAEAGKASKKVGGKTSRVVRFRRADSGWLIDKVEPMGQK